MITRVKKLLLIFMLMMLPLQFSWAAVAAYCQHESEIAMPHIGHHTHGHQQLQVNAANDDAQDSNDSPGFDADCISCHGGATGILALSLQMMPDTVALVTRSSSNFLLASTIPDRPERPNWALAV